MENCQQHEHAWSPMYRCERCGTTKESAVRARSGLVLDQSGRPVPIGTVGSVEIAPVIANSVVIPRAV